MADSGDTHAGFPSSPCARTVAVRWRSMTADAAMLSTVSAWPAPTHCSAVGVWPVSRLQSGSRTRSRSPRKMTTAMRLPTNMEPAGAVKRPTVRSMASACRMVKLICTPMETLSTMAALHSGMMRSTVLNSSTCCTVHTRHGRSTEPLARPRRRQ